MGDKLNLEENCVKYKDITLAIIEAVKANEYEKLDKIFQQRQLILDNISEINYSKEELKKFYFKYEIDKLDKILDSEMNFKKEDLLKEIKENEKRQMGVNGYNNLVARAVFFSKEI